VLSTGVGINTDRIFADFDLASRQSLIVAVSGGSDSLALLLLLEAFLKKTVPAIRLVAVTIDHGLRPEAAGEAQYVAEICRGRGIFHRTMRWQGDKPKRGIPAAAREARYDLLAEAAAAERTDLLLTGHTCDDQLETVAMRKARGDGRGLAGMASATLFDGKVWILRPLLKTARAELRAWLAERDIRWIDDPTNVDRSYERPRIRGSLPGPEDETALRVAEDAARERMRQGQLAAALVEHHAFRAGPGLLRLDPHFASEPAQAGICALRMLLAVTGGTAQLPDAERTSRLFEQLSLPKHRATLSRSVVDVRRAGIFLHRERRGLPEVRLVDRPVIWDGRFRIEPPPNGTMRISLGRLSPLAEGLEAAEAPESLVRAALATEPRLDPLGNHPGQSEGGIVPILAPWARFLPGFDLAPYAALAKLIGAKAAPRPPFAGHNSRQG
jgi:tRNA(Ile)-lysidine synthase